jgi:hypothetical protein
MPKNKDLFERTAVEATRKELQGAAWSVYEHFETERQEFWDEGEKLYEDVFLYAPFRPTPIEPGTIGVPQDRNLKRTYAPLRDVPDLFLRFAGLRSKGRISQDKAVGAMRDWATTYGVLGLKGLIYPDEIPVDVAGNRSRRESLLGFTQSVREAAQCLELYEAATVRVEDYRSQNRAERRRVKAVSDTLENYGADGNTLREKQEWAYVVSGDIVGKHVRNECYPELYRTVERGEDGKARFWYEQRTIGFQQGWEFRSLLGAMYLQMMLYMIGGGEGPRCKRPDCYRTVTFSPPQPAGDPGLKKGVRGKYRTRKDKEFCSKACAQWWSDNYGDSKKAKQKRKRQSSDSI